MSKKKLPLQQAQEEAQRIIELLSPDCERIEVAGSIRRKKPQVGDIELVAIPKMTIAVPTVPTLFPPTDQVSALDQFDYSRIGVLVKGGSKFKQVELHTGQHLDLFIVTPPAQWGVIFTLRTGDENFSHLAVTKKRFGGLLPSNLRVSGGAVLKDDILIPTPEEADFLRILGLEGLSPEARTNYRPKT